MSLKSVAQMFQIERDGNNHNALEDANITYSCLKEYIKLSKQVKLTK
jgi:inhibitor of KinA sporulation pathway (predicted exonuclease)